MVSSKLQTRVVPVLRLIVVAALLCGAGENAEASLAGVSPSTRIGGRMVVVALVASGSTVLFGRRRQRRSLFSSGRP